MDGWDVVEISLTALALAMFYWWGYRRGQKDKEM